MYLEKLLLSYQCLLEEQVLLVLHYLSSVGKMATKEFNIQKRRFKLGKRVLIIGLGVFGQSLVNDLKEQDVELIVADQNMSIIESFKNNVDLAVCMDTTDEESLKKLSPADIDVAVIAIGENFDSVKVDYWKDGKLTEKGWSTKKATP